MTPPKLLTPALDAIPAELRQHARWAPWRAVWDAKRGKYDKIPAFHLSTAKPEQWFSFDAAWRDFDDELDNPFAGLGYCMTGPHGIVGVDLDGCVDELGTVAPWAQAIVDALASYTEVSPSGRGLRIFALGELPRDWTNHDVGIEVYAGHAPRFLTVTGLHLPGTPLTPRGASGGLAGVTAQYARAPLIDAGDEDMPELLDELALPDPLQLTSGMVATFLTTGEATDRSGALHAAGVALYAAGLNGAVVLSMLVANEHAWQVALDHRRQDPDRAMAYLWREHCVKARGKAKAAVASVDDFSAVEVSSTEAPEARTDGVPSKATESIAEDWPKFKRKKDGSIEATVDNVVAALRRPDFCRMTIRYDEFRDEVMYANGTDAGAWQSFRDQHYVALRLTLERHGFLPIGRELIRDAVHFVAETARFDSAIEWLRGLQWDGVARIDAFYSTHMGAVDSPYTRAAARYTWTALAGRVLSPGIKCDMVPILIGPQGTVKSSGIAAMAPAPEFFTELSLTERDDDQARKMRGKLIAEVAELRGLHTRDIETIRAFVTRTHEHWVPKFKEFTTTFPRRLLLIGTSNPSDILADEHGNRRWLPITVGRVDVAAIARDRLQLWAEAAARFDVCGVEYQEAETLAPAVHEQHMISEVWSDVVAQWLDTKDPLTGEIPRTREFLQVAEVARGALRLDDKQVGKREEMRIGVAMRECGFIRVLRRVGNRPARVWTPRVTTSQPPSASGGNENSL